MTVVGALAADCGVTDADVDEATEFPTLFVARAVKVYAMPFVRPRTSQEVAVLNTVHVNDPGDDVTAYPVIAEPPLTMGAVKETVAAPAVDTDAVSEVGGSGTVAGMTGVDAVDADEVKRPLFAVALKV